MPDRDFLISYKPSAFYLRKALREASTIEGKEEVACLAILELEQLKEWIRGQGLIPPKWNVTREEAEEKGWDCCS